MRAFGRLRRRIVPAWLGRVMSPRPFACLLGALLCAAASSTGIAADPSPAPVAAAPLAREIALIRSQVHRDWSGMLRAEGGAFKHPFLTPGSAQYPDILWDWDSWLSNVALRQILAETATPEEKAKALRHERGCVLNYLDFGGFDGWVPIIVLRHSPSRKELMAQADPYATNMHKPCLAQHAAFLTQLDGGDAEWLRERMFQLQSFVNRYKNHQRHAATGLYFWNDDTAIGVDNDPSTFMRPAKSSGSIFLTGC